MMRARRLSRTGLATLVVFAGGLVLATAPALAAAPEAPVTEAPTANTTGTTATFNGELTPGLVTEKVAYHFAYSAGSTAACTESGLTAPAEPFPEAEDNEKVSEPVTGLEASTEYTVCLIAANPAEPAESMRGTSVKFKTPASKPVVESQSASGVTPLDATLDGQVNPENQETTYHLEYATTSAFTTGVKTFAYGIAPPGTSSVQTLGPVDLGGALAPDTTYYYRVVAKNPSGEARGTVAHAFGEFTTEALKPPSIEGESVTSVTQTTASLSALIDPGFQPVTVCEFVLSGGVAPASCAPAASELGEGGTGVGTGASLVGLQANTEYHYKLLAKNATGLSEGATQNFLTLPNPPVVLTGGASEVGPNGAVIAGTVNPGSSGVNSDTTYYFQYSTGTSYDTQIPLAPGDAGQGESAVPETAGITGLEPDTAYHYRIVASNDNANTAGGAPQVVYGEGETFTTPATPPLLGPASASAITQSAATINATLEARGLPTHWELRLGSTPGSLESQASGNTMSSLSAPEPIAANVGSLTPGTTYYYKFVAVNPDNQQEPVETPEGSFTTVAVPLASSVLTQPPTPLLSLPNIEFPKEEAGITTPPKALTRAQKLTKALKACKGKPKKQRAACEKQARAKYRSGKKSKR